MKVVCAFFTDMCKKRRSGSSCWRRDSSVSADSDHVIMGDIEGEKGDVGGVYVTGSGLGAGAPPEGTPRPTKRRVPQTGALQDKVSRASRFILLTSVPKTSDVHTHTHTRTHTHTHTHTHTRTLTSVRAPAHTLALFPSHTHTHTHTHT